MTEKGFYRGLLIGAILAALLTWFNYAQAGGKPRPENQQHQGQGQGQDQGQQQKMQQGQGQAQEATAVSKSGATADASSVSEGSQASSDASNGDQVSLNTSQFYALSLMFPQATNCFTGAQGGAQGTDADKGVSGFLGIHLLNTSCWLDQLADEERDLELNARLRCGDKKYRNAIAYDVPRKERQARCIEMKKASGMALIENHKAEMQAMLDRQDRDAARLAECHDRIDDANERTERCTAQWLKDQEK